MNGWAWLALAAFLAAAGVMALAVTHRGRAAVRPEPAGEPQTPPVEGDATRPDGEGMFTPLVESTPAAVARHWRERDGKEWT